jgi:hypothetical protein
VLASSPIHAARSWQRGCGSAGMASRGTLIASRRVVVAPSAKFASCGWYTVNIKLWTNSTMAWLYVTDTVSLATSSLPPQHHRPAYPRWRIASAPQRTPGNGRRSFFLSFAMVPQLNSPVNTIPPDSRLEWGSRAGLRQQHRHALSAARHKPSPGTPRVPRTAGVRAQHTQVQRCTSLRGLDQHANVWRPVGS